MTPDSYSCIGPGGLTGTGSSSQDAANSLDNLEANSDPSSRPPSNHKLEMGTEGDVGSSSGGGRKRRGRTRRRHRSRHRRRRRHGRSRRSTKGSRSKTHRGDKNYTTKRGDKDFHRRRHDIRSSRSPYRRASGSRRAYSFF